jgi:hypothetical protein
MDTTPERWAQVAFSQVHIKDFLTIVALSPGSASELLSRNPSHMRCFGTGFYFFANGIREELAPSFGEELHTLACRVEQTCNSLSFATWDQLATKAQELLTKYFANEPN